MKNLLKINNNNNNFINALNFQKKENVFPEIVFLTTFPPRECGIATYSQDLIFALNNKFRKSFTLKIVALEIENENHKYTEDIYAVLTTDNQKSYIKLAEKCNQNDNLQLLLIQHEFGLFRNNESDFFAFLAVINKPKLIVFHTVLPNPDKKLKQQIKDINSAVDAVIVMTKTSAKILVDEYDIPIDKISIIPHGTHLVEHLNKEILKEKYGFEGRKILSTFGLLSSGKSIETTLDAMPSIAKNQPNVLFLIIGKTHPSVVKNEGEKYREFLSEKIKTLQIQDNVLFVNKYLALPVLLEYLQLTDVYLFTSNDRNQTVSGTFSYALSCGCPIISTPIPHAKEVLNKGTGIIIDFENPSHLSKEVIQLLNDDELRNNIGLNGLHKMASSAWENAAISHAILFEKVAKNTIPLEFKFPEINLNHLKKMTTDFGVIQFSKINQPDFNSGYTLDDNARAMVAMCQHYELSNDKKDLDYIWLYFNFIEFCLQKEGNFLNYVDINKNFTIQNNENLDDSNGRAIWAIGYLLSISHLLTKELIEKAEKVLTKSISGGLNIHSTRAMAFIIKGIYLSKLNKNSFVKISLIKHFADKLVQMYRHEADENWKWYESYLTYANSILPEALLYAYLATGEIVYKEIAQTSFHFLLSKTFKSNSIKVISNKGWHHKNEEIREKIGGEQPIDIAYTIIALSKFYQIFREDDYLQKMRNAFNWFMGDNHLNQIIYNPCTGGCYDGLEEDYINLNQGAESTVSYLMARLTIQKQLNDVSAQKAFVPKKVMKKQIA